MGSLYRLQIKCSNDQKEKINSILGIENREPATWWNTVIEEDSQDFTRALDIYIDLIARNLHALKKIGVSSKSISIWYLYEYEQQCNMEFGPHTTKQIGELGVTLCV